MTGKPTRLTEINVYMYMHIWVVVILMHTFEKKSNCTLKFWTVYWISIMSLFNRVFIRKKVSLLCGVWIRRQQNWHQKGTLGGWCSNLGDRWCWILLHYQIHKAHTQNEVMSLNRKISVLFSLHMVKEVVFKKEPHVSAYISLLLGHNPHVLEILSSL